MAIAYNMIDGTVVLKTKAKLMGKVKPAKIELKET